MPVEFDLSAALKNSGWKLKIREKETVEPPHVSVIKGLETWRWNLREKKFMDKQPPPRSVPKEIKKFLEENHDQIVSEWDKKYPLNPVQSGGKK